MSIKYAILGLLQYQDLHGYRVKKHIENYFENMWSINYGQIYPALKQLADDGFVEVRECDNKGGKGPQRKLYSITDRGRDEFSRWLAAEPEKKVIIRDPFLMRFVFYSFGNHERLMEIIDDQIKIYTSTLAKRQNNLKRWSTRGIHVRLLAELGIENNRTYLQWLKRVKREMSADHAKGKKSSAGNYLNIQ